MGIFCIEGAKLFCFLAIFKPSEEFITSLALSIFRYNLWKNSVCLD
jgi:hypothetical protein